MHRFIHLDAFAASLPLDNIDTDKILPGEYLKTVSRTGLGRALFARMRYQDDGREITDFVLNQEPWREAGILIGGDNFGCGSSREHAPWALTDFGISCIIAGSFADIFYNNCFKNGILPIVLAGAVRENLARLAADPATARMVVDLEDQTIGTADGEVAFKMEPDRKAALIEGRDDIAETLAHQQKLALWEVHNRTRYPTTDMVIAIN